MPEPGLDRHEWESEWRQLEPIVVDSPLEALPELLDLVRRLLEARGYAIDDEVVREGNDPAIIAEYLSARELTTRAEGAGELGPADLGAAIASLRLLYEHLAESRDAP